MAKPNSTMGKLLSAFRIRRDEARKLAHDQLWRAHKLENPARRDGHEIRETSITDRNGNTLITVQLWKKIDEKRIKIGVNIAAGEIKNEEIGDLIDG